MKNIKRIITMGAAAVLLAAWTPHMFASSAYEDVKFGINARLQGIERGRVAQSHFRQPQSR